MSLTLFSAAASSVGSAGRFLSLWSGASAANFALVLAATRVARVLTGRDVRIPKRVRRDLASTVFGNVAVSSALAGWQFVDHLQLPHERASEAVLKLAAASLAAQVWFYFTHRAMHAYPLLYRLVHHVHHRWRETDPVATFYAHPVENLLVTASVLIPVGALQMSTPLAVAFAFGVTVNGIAGHCGEALGRNPHHIHHMRRTVHFGAGMLLDWLFGTAAADAYYHLPPTTDDEISKGEQ